MSIHNKEATFSGSLFIFMNRQSNQLLLDCLPNLSIDRRVAI